RRVFGLVRDGLRVVGTLHADSVEEAIEVLGGEVELSPEDVARADLIAVTRVVDGLVPREGRRFGHVPRGASVRRRIVEIGLLGPGRDGGVERATLATLSPTDRLELADAPAGIAALARWASVSAPSAAAEIAARTEALSDLAAAGRR